MYKLPFKIIWFPGAPTMLIQGTHQYDCRRIIPTIWIVVPTINLGDFMFCYEPAFVCYEEGDPFKRHFYFPFKEFIENKKQKLFLTETI
jgi:hypothetical protein